MLLEVRLHLGALEWAKLTITVDLVHILWWDANDTALLNDFWIFAHYSLYNLKVFHGYLILLVYTYSRFCDYSYQRLHVLRLFPLEDLTFG